MSLEHCNPRASNKKKNVKRRRKMPNADTGFSFVSNHHLKASNFFFLKLQLNYRLWIVVRKCGGNFKWTNHLYNFSWTNHLHNFSCAFIINVPHEHLWWVWFNLLKLSFLKKWNFQKVLYEIGFFVKVEYLIKTIKKYFLKKLSVWLVFIKVMVWVVNYQKRQCIYKEVYFILKSILWNYFFSRQH